MTALIAIADELVRDRLLARALNFIYFLVPVALLLLLVVASIAWIVRRYGRFDSEPERRPVVRGQVCGRCGNTQRFVDVDGRSWPCLHSGDVSRGP